MDTKVYFVEGVHGGYAESFDFKEACNIAKNDSSEMQDVLMVRHIDRSTPDRIYYCGELYKLVKKAVSVVVETPF